MIIIAFFIGGCSATEKASKDLDSYAKSLTPPADKALVYILRPSMYGSIATFNVTLDGKFIGSTGGKRFLYMLLEPGIHTFSSKGENRKELPIELEGGQTYFLEQEVHMGILSARNKLVRIDERDGRFKLEKCFLSNTNVYRRSD